LYSNKNSIGVVSFNIDGMTSNDTCIELEKHGFETRSGLHCAPMVHRYYNTTNIGMCRIGLSHNNTIRQLKKLINVIKEI